MILRLIDWFLAKRGERRAARSSQLLELTPRVQALAIASCSLIAQMDKKPFRGEYKRRQVYAQLVRAFPADLKMDVALAIEVAVRMVKGKL